MTYNFAGIEDSLGNLDESLEDLFNIYVNSGHNSVINVTAYSRNIKFIKIKNIIINGCNSIHGYVYYTPMPIRFYNCVFFIKGVDVGLEKHMRKTTNNHYINCIFKKFIE